MPRTLDPDYQKPRKRKRINRRACRPRRHLGKDFPVYDFALGVALAGRKKNNGELLFYGSTRTIMEECRLSKGAAHRALQRVVADGWLVPLPGQKIWNWSLTINIETGEMTTHKDCNHAGVSVRYRVLTHDEWLAEDNSRTCPIKPEDREWLGA